MNLLAIIFAILAGCALTYQFGAYFALSFFSEAAASTAEKDC